MFLTKGRTTITQGAHASLVEQLYLLCSPFLLVKSIEEEI